MEEIIETIKSTYEGHEDLEEIVTDLSEDSSIDWWAKKFCEEDYGKNIDLARKLFKIMEVQCEDSSDINSLAQDISCEDTLNDKAWAKELYEKAIELAEDDTSDLLSIADNIANSNYQNDKTWAKKLYEKIANNLNTLSDYNNLIGSINSSLKDKKWANKLTLQAKEALMSSDDKSDFAVYGDDILSLADIIADVDFCDDKESAKEVFELIKEYESVTDLLDTARKVKDIYDDDTKYVENFMNECLDKAIDNVDEGYYCDIYYFIQDDMEDADKAQEFRDEYEDGMRNDYEELGYCEELFGDSEDDMDVDDIDFDDYDDRRNVVAFSTNSFTFVKVEEMIGEDGIVPKEGVELMNESVDEFIDTIKEKFDSNVEDTVHIAIDGKLKEYNSDIDSKVEDLEGMILYMIFTKEIPADILNTLFLDMDEYGFYATFDNGSEVITQGYDYGEYDTGYFSNDQEDCYINNFKYEFKLYPEVKKLFVDNE